jgi:hypothetical protein
MSDANVPDFFASFAQKSGVYFITPFYDPEKPDTVTLVKIGMSKALDKDAGDGKTVKSSGLKHRLDGYLLCYPFGFYVFAVLPTKARDALALERYFHEYFISKNFKSEFKHSHSEEWFWLTPKDLYTSVSAYVRGAMVSKALTNYLTEEPSCYKPPVYVSTTFRAPPYRKQPLHAASKQALENFMIESDIPSTLKKGKRPKQLSE